MKVARYVLLAFLAAVNLLILLLPLMTTANAGYLTFVPFCALPLFFFSLLLLLFVWKHKKERFLLLSLLLLSLLYLHPYIPRPSSFFSSLQTRQQPGTLTVVSWNCDNFQLSEDTLKAAAEEILSMHPDIICLQERPHNSLLSIEKIKMAFSGYPYMVTNDREDEILNVMVFSRFPLSNPLPHYFPETFNKYLSVDVHLPSSLSPKVRMLRLYDIHLQTTGLSDQKKIDGRWLQLLLPFRANSIFRDQQAKAIAYDISLSPYPVMVCGDFNAIRTSFAYRTVAHRLRDTFGGFCGSYTYHVTSLCPWVAKLTHCTTIPVKIDHILVSSPLRPSYYLQSPFLSGDHRIQCAVVKLPQ